VSCEDATRVVLIMSRKGFSTGFLVVMFTQPLLKNSIGENWVEDGRSAAVVSEGAFLPTECLEPDDGGQGADVKVDVRRRFETSEAITGEFWLDGIKECFYLEPSRFTPFYPGHPCIQAGTYRVVLTMSPHLGYVCPEVLDVPGRTAIRWHIGNFPKDVLGCCVVGIGLGTNMVSKSKEAFEALMAKLEGQEITAEYHDPISLHRESLDGVQMEQPRVESP
jgi:hypothetical protein